MMNRLIHTVANQLIIEISPYDKHTEKPYGIITQREQIWAGRLLNDKTASHILYYYMATNNSGYKFALSPTAIYNQYGVTEKQYHTAIKKLKEVGYLVQKKQGSNIWQFMRVPEKYKSIDILPFEPIRKSKSPSKRTDQVLTEHSQRADSLSVEDTACIPRGQTVSPQRENRVPPEDREILQDIIYNTNNIDDVSYNISNYPDREKVNDTPLENERDILINEFNSEFGHLDNSSLELISAEGRATMRGNSAGRLQRHINFLRKAIEKMKNQRESRNKKCISEYQRAIKNTMPKDSMAQIKIKLILDRYINEHNCEIYPIKKWRELYGVWLNGWNKELHEPKVTVAMYCLPLHIVAKQRHNIEGIPEEYWKKITK